MDNIINKDNWSFEYNNLPGDFLFKHDGEEILESTGVDLGILQEKFGFEEKCRFHKSEKCDNCWIETETKHPFGAEPVVKHKYEQCTNHIRVTTDIQISHQLPMENMTIDKLLIHGDWDKIEAITIEDSSTKKLRKVKVDFDEENNYIFQSMPLVLLFEKENGFQLEVGCGFDLWRWNIANLFEADSNLILAKTDSGYSFNRTVAEWDEEYEMGKRNFRFSWYFAWSAKNDNMFDELSAENVAMISFAKGKFKTDSTKSAFKFEKKSIPMKMMKDDGSDICFCSNAFNNSIRRWIRSIYNDFQYEEKNINLIGLKPGLCEDVSHVSSKKQSKQMHFDYLYLFGLYEWAKQYLGESDISLGICLDKNSLFCDLPSAKGLI